MRASYRDDAAFLIRLEVAIDKDTRQTAQWRKETGELVHALAIRLMAAPHQGVEPAVERSKQRQAR